MKAIYLTVVFIISFVSYGKAQTQTWQWATGPLGSSTVTAITTDVSGNAYITGQFLGTLILDADTITDTEGPYQEVYVAKYDVAGNLLWARFGKGYADAAGLSADAHGNLYLTGSFYNDSVSFGSYTLTDPNRSNEKNDIFLVKYDATGNVLWAKNLGGINNDEAHGVSTDLSDNVYITGNFTGNSLTLNNIALQHLGATDGFIAKLDSNGNAGWIRNIGSAYRDGSAAVCADSKGNVFMAGYFINSALYSGSLSNAVSSPYADNMFINKYDSSGFLQWSKYAGGNNGNGITGLAADENDQVYITGYYSDTINFGSTALTGAGLQNIFTAKYDTGGQLLWAKTTGGTYADQANSITVDGAGNAYITGYFESDTVLFGGNILIDSIGNQVSFIAKYDVNGNEHWVVEPGGTSNNDGVGVSFNAGSVYVAGSFESSKIIFGTDTLLPSHNIYLAKLDSVISTTVSPVPSSPATVWVYPNPSAGTFCFKGAEQTGTIEVFDLTGQLVLTEKAEIENGSINLSGRMKGIYLYKILDRGGLLVYAGKLVIQ